MTGDFISARPTPSPTGGGAPRGGRPSGRRLCCLFYSLHRLSLWPMLRRLQDGKVGIGGEQDKHALQNCF